MHAQKVARDFDDENIDGAGTAATLIQPMGIALEGNNVYVADSGNNEFRAVDITTGVVKTPAGSGVKGFAHGAGATASFSSPKEISNRNDVVYVADARNNAVRQINIATGMATTLAGKSGSTDEATDGGDVTGAGKGAALNQPSGLVAVGDNLYVADTENQKSARSTLQQALLPPCRPQPARMI